ncbi:MAG TPA: hypothetical protein VGQ58_11005 [Candidatus Limnocylindrales bacterium]|jgi:hypothetical protein|nr:hypothetical protein [Candidatus Limnocylindrales bacterium]
MDRNTRQPIADQFRPVQRGAVPPRRAAPPPASGLRIGPLAITPVRVVLVLALVGALAYVAFALTVRDTAQLPLLSSGAAVLGIAFMALAVSGFLGIRQAGYEGRDGRAVVLSLLGGLAAIIAFGCFAMAIVLAMEA